MITIRLVYTVQIQTYIVMVSFLKIMKPYTQSENIQFLVQFI